MGSSLPAAFVAHVQAELADAYLRAHECLTLAERAPRRSRAGHRAIRELVVLWHLSNGHSDKAIAAHMGLDEETVKTYLRLTRRKLGLVGRRRTLLVATVIRRRLVP